jgi:hypothetical protein
MNTEENITTETDVSTVKSVNPTMETCAGGDGCECTCVKVDTSNSSPKEEGEITTEGTDKTEEGEEASKTEEEDKCENGIDRDVIKDLISIFDDVNFAYPLNDVIAELRKLGYDNPGTVITLALQDDVIYVDSVEDSGMVYIAVIEQDEEE